MYIIPLEGGALEFAPPHREAATTMSTKNAQQIAHEAARQTVDAEERPFFLGGRAMRHVQRAAASAWIDANASAAMAPLARKWLAMICAVAVQS